KSATPAEVVERVKAVLRRAGPRAARSAGRLRFGELELDLAAHEVLVAGKAMRLTAKEFSLLRLFAEHPRQVFSRDHLFDVLWGECGDRCRVGVYIRRLRDKVEAQPRAARLIVTVWGVGYRFDPPDGGR